MSAEEFALKLERKTRIKRNSENDRRTQYYRRQKLFGLLFVVFAIIMFTKFRSIPEMVFLGVVATIAGIYIMTTRHMMIVDSYFCEMETKGKLI